MFNSYIITAIFFNILEILTVQQISITSCEKHKWDPIHLLGKNHEGAYNHRKNSPNVRCLIKSLAVPF